MAKHNRVTEAQYKEHILVRVLQTFAVLPTAVVVWGAVTGNTYLFLGYTLCIFLMCLVLLCQIDGADTKKSSRKEEEYDSKDMWTLCVFHALALVCAVGGYMTHEPIWGLAVIPSIWTIIICCVFMTMALKDASAVSSFKKWSQMNKDVSR